MKHTTRTKPSNKNSILALCFTLLIIFIIGVAFDYYYNLNDDMLMKDIVSGMYTGVPQGHNIQMLFPISWLISIPYFLFKNISWYGLFYLVCNYCCIFLIMKRIQEKLQGKFIKLGFLALGLFFLGAFFLWDLIFIQYTVTSAILGTTAIFLFLTNEPNADFKWFMRQNAASILLVVLAFLVRSEMLLLLVPYIGVAGIVKWSQEEKPFSSDNFKKYLSVIGLMVAGIVVSLGIHTLAYSSDEWKQFNEFFDNRTQLYDYQKIPAYEGNEAFYEGIGLTSSQQKLLENYNFGIEESIDEKVMGEVATYADQIRTVSQPQRIIEAVKQYYRRLVYEHETPDWEVIILALYGMGVIICLLQKKYKNIFHFLLLFGVRSSIWIYLLYGERTPERLTHSVYFVELMMLTAFILLIRHRDEEKKMSYTQYCKPVTAAMVMILCLIQVGAGITNINEEIKKRETMNVEYQALQEYCAMNTDSYYFLDIYSIVAYTEKVFAPEVSKIKNYDYMGGWGCKSPLYYDKLKAFQLDTMEQGITSERFVYLISKSDSDISWLSNYLKEKGYVSKVNITDTIQVGDKNIFNVYQVTNENK